MVPTNTITSRNNPLIKRARAVRDRKNKEFLFVEGLRLSREAITSGIIIEEAICASSFLQDARGRELTEQLERQNTRIVTVSEKVMDSVVDTKGSQGVVLIARKPYTGPGFSAGLQATPLLLVIHQINNPANAGAMLRAAEAAGANGVIATKSSADILSPKALRGSMGSVFRLPLWLEVDFSEAVEWCRQEKITTVALDAHADTLYNDFDWSQAVAIVVGSEAHGLAREEISAVDRSVKVPMREPVESLNVAVAASIVMYEAARQRAKAVSTRNRHASPGGLFQLE